MKGRSPKEMAHSSAARRVGWACCGCADIMWAGAGPAYFQRTLLEVVSRSGQKERPLRHRPAAFCRDAPPLSGPSCQPTARQRFRHFGR